MTEKPTTLVAPWYADLVLYEVYPRGFYDSNGDGIGDLPGLTQKLGYIRDLGVGAIWLMPIYPSPRMDDGYDVSDYFNIHPDLGTLDDFRKLLDRAHALGLRVLTDLVINHTSERHPWFQSARHGPGSPYHDYYLWSPTPDRFAEVRVIFSDTETSNWTYDPACGLYYFHRFYSHQPDLNYDNPKVREEVFNIARFWLDLGVDGFRVDAAPYLFKRDGTTCESLPETHAFFRELRKLLDTYHPPRIMLAEANQPVADMAQYFGNGDEFHMVFQFPLMPRLFLGVLKEVAEPLAAVLRESPVLPPQCQWAFFLRNHDELSLEMVSDDERRIMQQGFASDPGARFNLGICRRLWPLLMGGRRQIELLHALIFGLPGCSVLYYGDEICMGDNVQLGERHGVRTPMQWSAGTNAGFSSADPTKLYAPPVTSPDYHFAGRNVEGQERQPTSFLRWLRRMTKTHRVQRAFRGTNVKLVATNNERVLAFIRQWGTDMALCIYNLSRYCQPARVELADYAGRVPVEVIGGAEFPRITREPYLFTLGPHTFFWMRLETR